jgi:hypothetical protein
MMQVWADLLDDWKTGATNVKPLKREIKTA